MKYAFSPIFKSVKEFLESNNIACELCYGRKISDVEFDGLSRTIKTEIPIDLSRYLKELGDGFSIQWEHPNGGELVCFGLSPLEDILPEYIWVQEHIREISAKCSHEIRAEGQLGIGWLPIIGIGEGGAEFCMDTRKDPSPICYYNSSWNCENGHFNKMIAKSLYDLIERWGRYCFSPPLFNNSNVNLSIIASKFDGDFNWSSSWFNAEFDLGAV